MNRKASAKAEVFLFTFHIYIFCIFHSIAMFNKQYLFTLLLLFLCTGFLSGQSSDSIIKDIQIKYQSIRDNLKGYDTVSSDIWEESAEGGRIIGYYNGKELKFIKGSYFGETGKTEMEYYFDNGVVFFVFEKKYNYNRPIYWDKKHMEEYSDTAMYDPAKTILTENRYYFHNEKFIRWLDNKKKEVDLAVGKNSSAGKELIDHVHKLQSKLKKNN